MIIIHCFQGTPNIAKIYNINFRMFITIICHSRLKLPIISMFPFILSIFYCYYSHDIKSTNYFLLYYGIYKNKFFLSF